jgi:SAM-dependent methyltransferase
MWLIVSFQWPQTQRESRAKKNSKAFQVLAHLIQAEEVMGHTLIFGGEEQRSHFRSLKNRARHWRDEVWDRRLGVSTFGVLPAVGTVSDPDWQVHYEPARYSDLFKMFGFFNLGKQDTFLDLGSGLGRAVFAAKQLGAQQAIGVEINRGLFERSVNNLESARKDLKGTQFFCIPAQDFTDVSATVVYLFNPFGEGTLSEVVRRLGLSFYANPRKIKLIYFNPLFDQVLAESGFMRLVDQWSANTASDDSRCKYKVSFWETVDC